LSVSRDRSDELKELERKGKERKGRQSERRTKTKIKIMMAPPNQEGEIKGERGRIEGRKVR